MIDLSLILLNTPCGIYSSPKESKYRAAFLSIKIKSNVFLLLFCIQDLQDTFHLLFKVHYLAKSLVKLGSKLKYLGILILMERWSKTKKN